MEIIIFGLVLALAFGSKGGGGGLFGGGGGGGSGGGGGGGRVDPKQGPGGKGTIWSLPGANIPANFDFGGNGLYIDPNCEFVIEGNLFWPTGFSAGAEEAPTLTATLNIAPDNSVLGFLDYLIDSQGIRDPYQIGQIVLEEMAPMCAAAPDSTWSPGFASWYQSFVERVSDYIDNQFGFGGGV